MFVLRHNIHSFSHVDFLPLANKKYVKACTLDCLKTDSTSGHDIFTVLIIIFLSFSESFDL